MLRKNTYGIPKITMKRQGKKECEKSKSKRGLIGNTITKIKLEAIVLDDKVL